MLTGGLATVLVTTRAFAGLPRRWYTILLNTAGIAATAGLALLHHLLPPATVVAVIAGWAVGAAALATATRPSHTPPRHNPPPTSALS